MGTEYEGMGLSPEELAALEEKSEETPPAAPAAPKPEDPPEDDPKPDDPPKDDPKLEDDPKPEDPPKDDPKPEDAPAGIEGDGYEDLQLQEFQPYDVRRVPDFDVKVGEFDKQRAELVTKFKEGELTLEDFLVKDREIQKEVDALRDAERDAVTLDKLNEQNAQRVWFGNVKTFIAEVKRVEGLDYNNATLNAALDNAVKTLAAVPENATKTHAWFLREAHRTVRADLGLARASAPKPEQKPAQKPASQPRAPRLDDVPPSLRRMPEAAPNDPKGEDEFLDLDKLEGLELEEALAKLSDAQARRYLRG